MSSGVAINVEHVSKSFKLPHEKNSTLKGALINFRRRGYEKQQVLNDVSFQVNKGEFFGIVGRNGSGKSTLLKLLAGIYSTKEGAIDVRGKVIPFIELGVGFNPELTGRENVYLSGALLGFSRQDMEEMYDDIVEFAELERFMDQKLKNYSSGMQVRLAFSIAIRAQGDILILDEVLAVGDAAFQQKCYDYFEHLKRQRQTIILVTHDMSVVRRFCSRAMLIENGDVKVIGSPEEVASQYTLDNMESTVEQDESSTSRKLGKRINHLSVPTLKRQLLSNNEKLKFTINYETTTPTPIDIGISISYQGVSLIEDNTKRVKYALDTSPSVRHSVGFEIDLNSLNPGRYAISTAVFDKKSAKLIAFDTDARDFVIDESSKPSGGVLTVKGGWSKVQEGEAQKSD